MYNHNLPSCPHSAERLAPETGLHALLSSHLRLYHTYASPFSSPLQPSHAFHYPPLFYFATIQFSSDTHFRPAVCLQFSCFSTHTPSLSFYTFSLHSCRSCASPFNMSCRRNDFSPWTLKCSCTKVSTAFLFCRALIEQTKIFVISKARCKKMQWAITEFVVNWQEN